MSVLSGNGSYGPFPNFGRSSLAVSGVQGAIKAVRGKHVPEHTRRVRGALPSIGKLCELLVLLFHSKVIRDVEDGDVRVMV